MYFPLILESFKSFPSRLFKVDAFIKHLKKGNEAVYVYLATKYHKKLFIYALSLTKDHADAQDIVQNVFLTVWKYHKRLNTTYSIKNFLYKTTYNEFVSHYHKKEPFQN
ncbi:hypothetical protein EM932_01355 [Flavivirga rizhaonensis]|uniref:RNA polymerase sigma-70 region 2 domain-containing protein n=1 Tax=Flavivirga rizhaonensis TaxID=2559571 RepID=A0A4S1E479_9FLAO|nr:hypothetical protein EM932_01355 [Flavivirga rizhaonensis]